jgi:hypothetical protein
MAGHAQGTIQFVWNMQGGHVLTATTDYTVSGFGTLVLNHGVLSYDLTIPNLRNLPEQTHFHADATAMIISLAPYVYLPPSGGSPGELVFKGSLNVSSSLPELLAGEWYVQLHSPDYENGRMRGYITPVPEPSATTMVVAAVCGFVCFRWFKRQTARRNG